MTTPGKRAIEASEWNRRTNGNVVCGVDPGQKGGICVHDGNEYHDYKMPLIDGRIVDVCAVQDIIIKHRVRVVYIELQRSSSRQRGQHVIGTNYGRLTAVFDLCGVRYTEVDPKVWKQSVFGRSVGSDKQASVDFCNQYGYFVPMTSTNKNASPHDGIADAHCIAHYGVAKELEAVS